MATGPKNPRNHATITATVAGNGAVLIKLGGRLNDATLPTVWPEVLRALKEPTPPGDVVVDVSEVSYCDGAGLGLFAEVRRLAASRRSAVTFQGFAPGLQRLVDHSALANPAAQELEPVPRLSFIAELGKSTSTVLADLYALVAFLGHLISALVWAVTHPKRIRYRDLFTVAEKAGVNAAPVVCLLGLLVGVILAFQCAIALRRYGAQQAIPEVVSIALSRELGPLIAAVLFAGRSGSAFTAEIGTMTVTEEIAALRCMGLEPVRYLVVPRVLAAMAMLPLLTTLCDLAGVLGGFPVVIHVGYSFQSYITAVRHSISYGDLLGGEAKAVVFGALIAGVGCMRGLRTASGPGAVGDSTTRSVVASIVLVILADAVFGTIYYYLGI